MSEGTSSTQHLSHLVFDAYGTLFDMTSVSGSCKEAFPDQGEGLSVLWRAKQLEYTWLVSMMGEYQDFWRITGTALRYSCDALGLTLNQQSTEKLMDAYHHLGTFPEVHRALGTLSTLDLSILSNGAPVMLREAVENAGIGGYFSNLISVDDARTYKPVPRVYQLTLDKLKVEKGSVGFISGNPFDVNGAKAFGFWTCWINRSEQPWERLGYSPDATISSLDDLPAVLGR